MNVDKLSIQKYYCSKCKRSDGIRKYKNNKYTMWCNNCQIKLHKTRKYMYQTNEDLLK